MADDAGYEAPKQTGCSPMSGFPAVRGWQDDTEKQGMADRLVEALSICGSGRASRHKVLLLTEHLTALHRDLLNEESGRE